MVRIIIIAIEVLLFKVSFGNVQTLHMVTDNDDDDVNDFNDDDDNSESNDEGEIYSDDNDCDNGHLCVVKKEWQHLLRAIIVWPRDAMAIFVLSFIFY